MILKWLRALDRGRYRLSTFASVIMSVALVGMWLQLRSVSLQKALLETEIPDLLETISRLESRVADYEGCRNPTPSHNPPLRVNFSDGRVARVSYNMHFLPVWEHYMPPGTAAPEDDEVLMELWLNHTERLLNNMVGVVHGVLEVHSFDYVTQNRHEIARQIRTAAQPLYDRLAFRLLEFNLWEICEVQANPSGVRQ